MNPNHEQSKNYQPSQPIHPATTAKDDRLQYLIEELSFLQAHVRSLADQAADIEGKFDFLNHEITRLQKLVLEDSSIDDDLSRFKNKDPTLQDKIELLAIMEYQQKMIDSLKKKKKINKAAEQEKEEEPRNFDIDQQLLESRATVETHKIELSPAQNTAGFSTFGRLPEETTSKAAILAIEKRMNKSAR